MIELRWVHDPFENADDISENAVLVKSAKEPDVWFPLILQYREVYGPDTATRWTDVPIEKG